jgi:hypothetical protein
MPDDICIHGDAASSCPFPECADTGCSCTEDPDTGELYDDDGWRCSH